jgi:uncharacterized protein DUF2844
MKNSICSRLFQLIIFATVLVIAKPSIAMLGEPEASVSTDRRALMATQGPVINHHSYQVQEIVSDTTRVREYISLSGIVFAISWNGMAVPDLNALLGSYADDYRTALQEAPREFGRRSRQIKTDRVVVEQWGHMRNLQGRAYAPALIPQGVSIDEIK